MILLMHLFLKTGSSVHCHHACPITQNGSFHTELLMSVDFILIKINCYIVSVWLGWLLDSDLNKDYRI